MIQDAISEQKLTGVVVAACSPRMHEPTFRRACAEAGLNPFLCEMANMREHCSWVHEKGEADHREGDRPGAHRWWRRSSATRPLLPDQGAGDQDARWCIGGGIAGIQAAWTSPTPATR